MKIKPKNTEAVVTDSEQKIYLDVPFTEKEQIKALGARWDTIRKRWYCSDSLKDEVTFSRWIKSNADDVGRAENKATHDGFTLSEFIHKGAPRVSRFIPFLTVTANKAALVCSTAQCYKCKDSTPVFAFAALSGQWANLSLKSNNTFPQEIDLPRIYGFVQKIDKAFENQAAKLAPSYKRKRSAKPMDSVYMNHCAHCASPIKEAFLHFKQDGSFSPDRIAIDLSDKNSDLKVVPLQGEGEIIGCDSEITYLNADDCWADTFEDRPKPDLMKRITEAPATEVQAKSAPKKKEAPIQGAPANQKQGEPTLKAYTESLAQKALLNTVMQMETDPDSWNRARLVITLPKMQGESGAICSLQMVQGEKILGQEKIVLTGSGVKMDIPDFATIKKTAEGYQCSVTRRTLPFPKAYLKIIELICIATGLEKKALLDYATPMNKQIRAIVFSVYKEAKSARSEITILNEK